MTGCFYVVYMNFWNELKRRHLIKVGVAYLAVAWLLTQLVVNVQEPLRLPGSFSTAVIVLLAIGFPVALIIAWAFELTPEGIRRSEHMESKPGHGPNVGRKLDYVIIAALSLAVTLLLVDRFLPEDLAPADDLVRAADANPPMPASPAVGMNLIPNSIAILPFETLSNDREDANFAEGVYADLFTELEKLDRLTVIGRRTMKRYENSLKSYQEIAEETNAQTVLELLVRYSDNRVRINTELVRVAGAANEVIWTEAYEEDYSSQNFFEMQTDIARNIAQRLVGELSPDDEARLAQALTENSDALSYYLKSLPYVEDTSEYGAENCIEPISAAVALDPGFKQAWLRKAACHDIRAVNFPEAMQAERQLSIAALEQAIAIDDKYADAYVGLAFALAYGGSWREAGRAYRTGVELGAEQEYPLLLFSMGHLQEALAGAERVFARDPENGVNVDFLMLLYETLGDARSSDRMFEVGQRQYESWNEGEFGRLVVLMSRVRQGQADPGVVTDYFQELQMVPLRLELAPNIDNPEAALAILRRTVVERAANPFAQTEIASWATYHRAPELALEALKNASSGFAINLLFVWTPSFREVRQLDGFKSYMREIGMVDYWRAFGWPDLCRPLGNEDFQCD